MGTEIISSEAADQCQTPLFVVAVNIGFATAGGGRNTVDTLNASPTVAHEFDATVLLITY